MKTYDVSREVYGDLIHFKELLLKWNNSINLISSNDILYLDERHINDSLQLLKFIPEKNISILDLGSGGGFPGIILSIAGVEKTTLVESDSRKAAFLLQASKISSSQINIINDRIENIDNFLCNIVTSRAFKDLDTIFRYTRNFTFDKLLLLKGETYSKEIEVAEKRWLFNVRIHDSITSEKGKVLEITDVKLRIL